MTLILKQLFAFFRLISSETETTPIAAGLSLGVILGFAPFLSIQTALVIFVIFFFRVQMGGAFLSAFFFKFIAYLFDPAADVLGRSVLENESLRPLFTTMFNMPLVPLTRFNNSIVMGSLIVSLILLIPSFFVFKILIHKYRQTVVARFKETKLWKAIKATKFYNWYATYEKLYT